MFVCEIQKKDGSVLFLEGVKNISVEFDIRNLDKEILVISVDDKNFVCSEDSVECIYANFRPLSLGV